MAVLALLLFYVAVTRALPSPDPVLFKLDPGPRYQYITGPDGTPHLADLWVKTSDAKEAARFNPDAQNVYYLFTRLNPRLGQPMVLGNAELVFATNYDVNKKTVVLVHGWMSDYASTINNVLVPAFLAAADVNVIVVDWSVGAGHINYATAVINTVTSGEAVARFIIWFNSITGSSLSQYHLAGHSLGGHQVGVIGRNLGGQLPYIISLDPAGPGWITNNNRFSPDDGIYTEVIHSNVGVMGYLPTLGQVDFYPNGGIDMPGCGDPKCDHDRALYYFGESLSTGGFTGRRCLTYLNAVSGTCSLLGALQMGGLEPKTGQSGIYHLQTNADSPFSQG